MTGLCFVSPPGGNRFMVELLAALAGDAAGLGVETRQVEGAFPDLGAGWAYVMVPHEYAALVPPENGPTTELRGRTIALCTEQPGTGWFELSASYAECVGAAFDISGIGETELRRRGIRAERFRLGWCEAWDVPLRERGDRDLDVLFMGSTTARRERLLAANAFALSRRRARILLAPERPKPDPRPDFVTGAAKRDLLARARVLLNIHRRDLAYFEWVRALEAICAGAVLVSEHAHGGDPLIAGEHFLSGQPEDLGLLANALLDDPDELAAIAERAYDFVRSELTMWPSTERLVAAAERLADRPRRRLSTPPVALSANGVPASCEDADPRRRLLKSLTLRLVALERRLDDLRAEGTHEAELSAHAVNGAWHLVRPVVSVCIPVRDHAREVIEALESVVAASGPEREIIVLDDCSTDGTPDVVREWMTEHFAAPVLLLVRRANRGLGPGRNDLLRMARGRYAFMLDADNEVYPACFERLVAALDDDPDALFAYGMLERHTAGEPRGLVSTGPWEPERFREGNYIDAMAMLRRSEVLDLGGYSEDIRLFGWEDFDLWCRVAETGGRGVLVPEIVGRYRQSASSMLSVSTIDATDAVTLLRELYPRTWPGVPPAFADERTAS